MCASVEISGIRLCEGNSRFSFPSSLEDNQFSVLLTANLVQEAISRNYTKARMLYLHLLRIQKIE